jgi:uncharacterized membrane-anchored protein
MERNSPTFTREDGAMARTTNNAARFAMAAALTILIAWTASPIAAQPPPPAPPGAPTADPIPWQDGPTTGKIGTVAEIQVPEGYQFTGKAGAQIWERVTDNDPDPEMEAVLRPSSRDERWTMIFTFDPAGYVKDDEKNAIDADELMKMFREGEEQANEQRRREGKSTTHNTRWEFPPRYDEATHNLTWAIKFDVQDPRMPGRSETVVNHNTRILGRTGVMSVILICDPEELSQKLPMANRLLTGFDYVSGQKYAEFKSGDKIAEYGLIGLIAGGSLVAAAKTGLLAKLGLLIAKGGKAIIVGVVALLAGIGALVKKLFGGHSGEAA